MKHNILLADIGNTHFHIYDGESVLHLSYAEAIRNYAQYRLLYISVKSELNKEIQKIPNWENISSLLLLNGAYDTMGVDRKALCLSHDNGIFVDAGSAITVDVVEGGIYQGGYIFPGIQAMLKSYKEISGVLDIALNENICLDSLPRTTKEGISYGIIASIKALIDKHTLAHDIYFTGGDGKLLFAFFENAIFDDRLVFRGMQKVIKDSKHVNSSTS